MIRSTVFTSIYDLRNSHWLMISLPVNLTHSTTESGKDGFVLGASKWKRETVHLLDVPLSSKIWAVALLPPPGLAERRLHLWEGEQPLVWIYCLSSTQLLLYGLTHHLNLPSSFGSIPEKCGRFQIHSCQVWLSVDLSWPWICQTVDGKLGNLWGRVGSELLSVVQ